MKSILFSLLISLPAFAAEGTPEIVKHLGKVTDTATRNLLFNYERVETITPEQSTVLKKYTYPDGKDAVVEELVYKNGTLVKFVQHQKQISAEGLVDVSDGKLNFSWTEEGKTKTDTEKVPENLVFTDEIYPFIKKNWEKIMAGDTISFRLPVPARRETVGFKIFKSAEAQRNGKDIVTVKMKPSSFVIAALVDPLHFKIEKEGSHKLVEIEGRTVPKIQKDGKWKDLDAILEIEM